MKYLRYFLIGGMIWFWVVLLTTFICAIAFPHILISYEYGQAVQPFAWIAALYAGLTYVVPVFIDVRAPGTASKTTGKRGHGQPSQPRLLLLSTALLAGCVTYASIPIMTATYLHQNAPKVDVEIKTLASSAWPNRTWRADCHYYLMVEFPKDAFLAEPVCINNAQWAYFRAIKGPVPVTLYGEKSYFGYELHCCK